MVTNIRIAILFSGRGSNMAALAEHIAQANVPADWVLAITNQPDAAGIELCELSDVPCAIIDHKNYAMREDFEAEMQKTLDKARVDLICAAGFARLLTPDFVTHWHDRIINIHPSLLPDYKGLHTHERVLHDGVGKHGCTVHYMRPEMDDGPIIVQKQIMVAADDTADSLAARVLEQEHIAYPEALDKVLALL
ncbi:MAG: phosphoribosylglycinamide formyltransferase [Parvibaculales bacterium]